MLEPGASSASLSLSGAACAGAWQSSLQYQHSVSSPARGTGLSLCGWWHRVPGSAHCCPPVGQDFERAGLRNFLVGQLILQAPGAAVSMSGAVTAACRHISPLPIPQWDVVVVWSWFPSPCLATLGLALWTFPCTGTIPHSRDLAMLGRVVEQRLSCGMDTELDTALESPCVPAHISQQGLLKAQMGAGRRDGSCGQSTCSHWFPFCF